MAGGVTSSTRTYTACVNQHALFVEYVHLVKVVSSSHCCLKTAAVVAQEVEGLRGQRDALARSLSFAREQYSDALGDKPVQIESLA